MLKGDVLGGGADCASGLVNWLGFFVSPVASGYTAREARRGFARQAGSHEHVRAVRRETPFGGGRTGRREGDLDPARADFHQRADLQQLQPDRAAGRSGKLRMSQADPAQRAEEDIGPPSQTTAQLVGPLVAAEVRSERDRPALP